MVNSFIALILSRKAPRHRDLFTAAELERCTYIRREFHSLTKVLLPAYSLEPAAVQGDRAHGGGPTCTPQPQGGGGGGSADSADSSTEVHLRSGTVGQPPEALRTATGDQHGGGRGGPALHAVARQGDYGTPPAEPTHRASPCAGIALGLRGGMFRLTCTAWHCSVLWYYATVLGQSWRVFRQKPNISGCDSGARARAEYAAAYVYAQGATLGGTLRRSHCNGDMQKLSPAIHYT